MKIINTREMKMRGFENSATKQKLFEFHKLQWVYNIKISKNKILDLQSNCYQLK